MQFAIATSTEVCHAKELPGMRESRLGVLVHDPTVRAKGNLLPVVCVTSDVRHGNLIQTLRSMELMNHIFVMRHSVACIYVDIQNVELRSLLMFSWNKW